MKPKNLYPEPLKPGTRLAILRRNPGSGNFVPAAGVYEIIDRNEPFCVWRYGRLGSGKVCGSFNPENGGGFRGSMSKNPEPAFYISANPAHVRIAERKAEAEAARFARQERARIRDEARRMRGFQAELGALLKKYGAEIYPVQTSGDDLGVGIEIELRIGQTSISI